MTESTFFTPTLQDAFNQAGLTFPQNADLGRITRFATGKTGRDSNGWLHIFPDGTGAAFGCWQSGFNGIWQQRTADQPAPTKAELTHARAQAAIARKQAEAEREALHQATAEKLATEYESLPIATAENGYCKRKGITPPGILKQDIHGNLVAPVSDSKGDLQSVQYIGRDGTKRFARDAKMAGGRFVFGSLVDGEIITLAEGFGTSASIHEAGISPVVNCFFGANLEAVAADLRKRYPDSFIRVAADMDEAGTGETYAKKAVAAAMPNADYILPSFADGRSKGDFNDLHQFADLPEVYAQLTRTDAQERVLSDSNIGGDAMPLPAIAKFEAPRLAVADARDGTATTRPLTEFGNALRLIDSHGVNLRFVPDVSGWLVWRGGAWHWDNAGSHVRSIAASLAASIYSEGSNFDMAQAEHFAKWARKSQDVRTIDAYLRLASDQSSIRLPLATVDGDSWLAGLDHARQVVDLKTGKARPATQANYLTKSLSPATIGEASQATRWQAFLNQVFDGDAELIDWLQRWCGYLLTGETSEQVFLFFFGLGANGKSVFAETIRHVLGDYGRSVSSETLTETKRNAGGASPDLADLIGCRLAMSSETEDGQALAESLVKSLTSGDTITARKLYREPVQFTPTFKLLMLGNHRPIIHGNDYGIWRRVRLIPFNKTFAENERDPNLLDKLKAEAPHILAWMVQGCMKWQAHGLADVPQVVRAQTADYRQEQDIIGQWLDECTTHDNQAETPAGDLYASHQAWSIRNGLKANSSTALGRRLGERGLVKRKGHGQQLWQRIKLTAIHHEDYARAKNGD